MSSYLKGKEFYDSLPESEKMLADKLILTTLDYCCEMFDRAFPFCESAAYKKMKWDIFGHIVEDEYYDAVKKEWKVFEIEDDSKSDSK